MQALLDERACPSSCPSSDSLIRERPGVPHRHKRRPETSFESFGSSTPMWWTRAGALGKDRRRLPFAAACVAKPLPLPSWSRTTSMPAGTGGTNPTGSAHDISSSRGRSTSSAPEIMSVVQSGRHQPHPCRKRHRPRWSIRHSWRDVDAKIVRPRRSTNQSLEPVTERSRTPVLDQRDSQTHQGCRATHRGRKPRSYATLPEQVRPSFTHPPCPRSSLGGRCPGFEFVIREPR